MAAKSILNEFYQRLRVLAPTYKTQAQEGESFLCTLCLPPIPQTNNAGLSEERTFYGTGSSKKVISDVSNIIHVMIIWLWEVGCSNV